VGDGPGREARRELVDALAAALMARQRRILVLAGRLLVGVAFLLLWEYGSNSGRINPVFYSSPSKIIALLGHQLGGQPIRSITIYAEIWITAKEVLIGYALGSVVGILLGFAVGRSRLVARAVEPYVLTFYAVPKISIAPLFVIFLGIGLTSKVAIVVLEAFFILFYNTYRGVGQVNEQLVHAARTMGSNRRTVLFSVLLPASLPSILAGLQLAVPFAVIGAVVGEYISSDSGLGWLVLYSGSSLDSTQLFAAIALLVILSWLLSRIVEIGVHRLAPWLPSDNRGSRRRATT
jgi:NitT/TauT family transport system permease protein